MRRGAGYVAARRDASWLAGVRVRTCWTSRWAPGPSLLAADFSEGMIEPLRAKLAAVEA